MMQYPARRSHESHSADIAPELFPDGARIGLCRVGSSHGFPELFNRFIGFQNHRNDRTFGHELDQTAENGRSL